MSYIPYGRQSIDQYDIDSVIGVLKSDFLTQGDVVPKFEQKIMSICNAQYCVAVNSATSALHLAYLSLGVGKGDIVWCPAITFVATANAAIYCGAEVDFVDINPLTFNLDLDDLKKRLKAASTSGLLPKLVTVVHMCGQPAQMKELACLGEEYGFSIVEDASHAIGSYYESKPTGCGQYSDIIVFSFHPVKIVTTGEGGVAVTNNEDLASKMVLLRSHGITRDASQMQFENLGDWYYEQIELGFNYRMTEMQAALGISQLDKLDRFVKKRQLVAVQYDKLLNHLPIDLPVISDECASSYHLYVIQLQLETCNQNHASVFKALRKANIGVNLHYYPVYLQPYYRRLGFKPGYCPAAELYASRAISLPMYFSITDSEVNYVANVLEKALII